ncbi:MAG: hypothetical protein RIM99_16025 [Cyclobacteriaceae bacterium]
MKTLGFRNPRYKRGPGGDLSSYYPGFTLSFTVNDQKDGGSYTVNNGVVWFGTSGTWTLNEGDTSNSVELENGLMIDVEITETELTLMFTSTSEGERSNGLGGVYTIKFSK